MHIHLNPNKYPHCTSTHLYLSHACNSSQIKSFQIKPTSALTYAFRSFFETTANTTYSDTRLDQLRPVNLVERPPQRVCGSSNAPTTTDSHKDLMENFYRLLGSY